jgi:hypothetical protein
MMQSADQYCPYHGFSQRVICPKCTAWKHENNKEFREAIKPIERWFDSADIGVQTLDNIIGTCLNFPTVAGWIHAERMTLFREQAVREHIGLRIRIYIDFVQGKKNGRT